MLRRGLLALWFNASLVWVLIAGLLYYFAFQEEVRIRPAGPEGTTACLEVAGCAQSLAVEYVLKAVAASFLPPLLTLAVGLAVVWIVARR